ncbi:MAG: Nif3-like dinuclear metal center hexameric protein [Bacillota bacterium]
MAVACRTICEIMETIAPAALAMDFDNVGLLVGDPDTSVQKVLVALEATPGVIDEAVQAGAQMILTHHPLMLEPVRRVTAGTGALVYRLARAGISLYAAHTNLDIVQGGVNDVLAGLLGLKKVERLQPYYEKEYKKIVVFVPADHVKPVQEALWAAGAGRIGAYGKCSFMAEGTGTFEVPENACPFVGRPGNFEQTNEIRLETVVPAYRLHAAVKAMLDAHPYEEPAYDVYALEKCPEEMGLGRVGDLERPVPLDDFAQKAVRALNCGGARVSGDKDAQIMRVAVCGGSGSGLLEAAAEKGAQLFVTGELKHHECLRAGELGLGVMLCGHYSTECVVLPELIRRLQSSLDALQYSVEFVLSEHSHELRLIRGE